MFTHLIGSFYATRDHSDEMCNVMIPGSSLSTKKRDRENFYINEIATHNSHTGQPVAPVFWKDRRVTEYFLKHPGLVFLDGWSHKASLGSRRKDAIETVMLAFFPNPSVLVVLLLHLPFLIR